MSTVRQGMVGTGNPGGSVDTDPGDPNEIAERRHQDTAKLEAAIPADSTLITSRVPEPAAYNITIDADNVLTGGRTSGGFIIWYCPNKLLDRLKKHMLVVGGRVVLPAGHEKAEAHHAAQHGATGATGAAHGHKQQ